MNVPLVETIAICMDALYNDEQVPTPNIPKNILEKRLMKATREVEFSFEGNMYRQKDGVAMGSLLGPIMANIFVGYLEKQIPVDEFPLL